MFGPPIARKQSHETPRACDYAPAANSAFAILAAENEDRDLETGL
jgi:hypothetical protein